MNIIRMSRYRTKRVHPAGWIAMVQLKCDPLSAGYLLAFRRPMFGYRRHRKCEE